MSKVVDDSKKTNHALVSNKSVAAVNETKKAALSESKVNSTLSQAHQVTDNKTVTAKSVDNKTAHADNKTAHADNKTAHADNKTQTALVHA